MKTTCLLLCLLFATGLYSQNETCKNEFKICDDSLKYFTGTFKYKHKELLIPEESPEYSGGINELEKYFDSRPLVKTEPRDTYFLVHIGFIVNCKGECGDFEIRSLGSGRLAVTAEELLSFTKEMPQKWMPAMHKGKAVDCYQLLSFSIHKGRIYAFGYNTNRNKENEE